MPTLKSTALVEARKKKGWTQAELSEATKPQINISTISRIERSKETRVRERTLKDLCHALGVSPADLCPTTEVERDPVKLRLESGARNALTLVALRYQVSRENIVELAPLLFFIAAEKCLKERHRRIVELQSAADSLCDMQRKVRHLPVHWPLDEGAMASEKQSIAARDLFGTEVVDDAQQFLNERDEKYEEAEHNPFVAFLRCTLVEAGGSESDAETVTWAGSPEYEICGEEAAALVGGDDIAARAILWGLAALHEMPKGSPAERAEWARSTLDSDLESSFADLPPVSKGGNNAPASGSGEAS